MAIKELPYVEESPDDWRMIQEEIIETIKRELYLPLIREIGLKKSVLKNSLEDLEAAIHRGQITYSNGKFTGRFTSTLSRELRRLGAEWDKKQGSWLIPQSKLPISVKNAISISKSIFQSKISQITVKLAGINPETISDKINIKSVFDTMLFSFEKKLAKSLDGIVVNVQLTDEQRIRIRESYNQNLDKYIKNFLEKQISELREKISASVFEGTRYESMIKTIQTSYGVTQRKAKFLARQETNLMIAAYKKEKYTSAGVNKYKWRCVAGSAMHPVRPSHLALNGKIFSFDDPPITTMPGEPVRRNNPREDYNCRCHAVPVIVFE